eukprot:SAG11_NODE_767_length_7273_cov_3.106914_10_plen_96_part_00
MLAQLAQFRQQQQHQWQQRNAVAGATGGAVATVSVASMPAVAPQAELCFLSYNVWFREDVQLDRRMEAIMEIVNARRPHALGLQELTPAIVLLCV